LLWIAIAAVLAVAAGVYAWQARSLPINAVVVRPFTAEGAPDWLAGAISEEIADALRPVTKGSSDPMFTGVLEGSVARFGDKVRVTATLTRGDGHRYWTRTVERPMVEVAREVAGAIVPAARKKAPKHKPTVAAYEHFLQGRQFLARQEYGKAVDGLDVAAELDPQFALAFAWAAIAREQLAEQGAARPNAVMPAARDDAERAVTLAPDSAEAHLALGIVKLVYDWEWDDAHRELDRALELSHGNPLAAEWKARWTAAVERGPAPALDVPGVPRDADTARRLLADAETLRSQAYVTPLQFALAANLVHDADGLFTWLDVACDARSTQLPYLLRNPALPQTDPRLRELLRRLKLPTDQ